MKHRHLVVALLVRAMVALPLLACRANAAEDSSEWRTKADLFMSNVVANRMDQALDLMEQGFIELAGGRERAKSIMETLFDYCGKPLDSQFQHEEKGFKLYLTGQLKESRNFFYDASTSQFPKGVCFFVVTIVRNDAGTDYSVTGFGPYKWAIRR